MSYSINNIDWSKYRSKKFLILFLIVILTLSKTCTHFNKKDTTKNTEGSKPSTILVKNVMPEKHNVVISLSGYIESKNSVKLLPQTDGIVRDITIQQGSKVNAGDVIVVLDEREKLAELKRTEQLVRQKKLELNISNKLLKNGDVPLVSNNQAKTSYDDALSQFEKAHNNLEFTKIKATISGYLDKMNVKKGDYVNLGNKEGIGSIFSDKSFIVVIQIPQIKIHQLKVGQKVLLDIGDKKIHGFIDFISNVANSGTRTYYSEIKLLEDENEFLSKMISAPVTAKIIYDEVLAVMLKDSITYIDDSGELTVKTVDCDNKVKSIRVKLLNSDENGKSWFSGDEFFAGREIKIIARGAGFFNDGDNVKNIEFEK